MSKLIQIESAIRAMDPAAFQRLCDAYLHQRGYAKPNPIGLVIGADKVKKGTPDTLVPLANGNYVFAEYTTEQRNVGTKLLRDLKKCFDEKKTGIPVSRIEEVVLCHTSVLGTEQEHALVECCKRHNCRLNVFGLGPLAHDLAEKYPGLARDYLSIEIDTGQIVTVDEFIASYARNALATPLDTTFRFRAEQLQHTVEELEAHSLILVSGGAGVGKSRFAVECCRTYAATHPDIEVRCIRNLGADLSGDIRAHFAPPGQYLILVDDANRLTGFDYLLHLLQEDRSDRTVKIIVTVRDYALQKVAESTHPFGGGIRVVLTALSDDQIKELAEREFGIANFHYLDRIAEIAKGNPRLAVMASRIAVEQNTLASIADVSALYDEYFRSVRQDLADVGDRRLLQAGGIIALYRAVDRSNEDQQREIADSFGIPANTFWEAVRRLNELELVDLYENEIVRVSDQVLATYLFYLAFFREKALNPRALLVSFFPKHRLRLFDALNPALSAFDAKGMADQLRPIVSVRWNELDTAETQDELLVFADAFGNLDATATLRLLRDRIRNTIAEPLELAQVAFAPSSSAPEPSLYTLMAHFRYADLGTVELVLGLLLDLVQKRPADLKYGLHLLVDRYGFAPTSHFRRFEVERTVVRTLAVATAEGSNLLLSGAFLVVAERFLRTHFTHIESKSRNTLSHMTFDLPASAEVSEIRRTVWKHLFVLYIVPALQQDVLTLIRAHAQAGYNVRDAELLTSDAREVLPALDRLLQPSRYSHCAVVRGYLRLLQQRQVKLDDALAGVRDRLAHRFASEAFQVAALMLEEFDDLEERGELGWQEYVQLRRNRLQERFAGYGPAEYEAFFEQCLEIREAGLVWGERAARWEERQTGPNRDDYQLRMGIAHVLDLLGERNPELFARVVQEYLAKKDRLRLDPMFILPRLVVSIGAERTAALLAEVEIPQSRLWWFAFFRALPAEAITPAWCERLLTLYREAATEELPHDLDYLLRYTGSQPALVLQVVELLVARAEQDQRVGYALMDLAGHGAISDGLPELFRADPGLLERAYFAASKVEAHMDYDARVFSTLLDLDPTFGARWVGWMAQRKEWLSRYDDSRHYQRLWLRDDNEKVFGALLGKLFDLEQTKPLSLFSYPEVFFTVADGAPSGDTDMIRRRQETLLLKMVEEHAADMNYVAFLFGVIRDLGAGRRRALLAAFLRRNKRFEDFQRLPLEPSSWGWSGSAVPMYQARVEFFESLLPLLNSVELLDHKLMVERSIGDLRKEIEREKRKDFMGED